MQNPDDRDETTSNQSFMPPPADGGQLEKKVIDGKPVFFGRDRSFEVLRRDATGRAQVRVSLTGTAPEVDTVTLTSAGARAETAQRWAGPRRPDLAPVFELDLRQIATDRPEGDAAEPGASADDRPIAARCDGLVDLVRARDQVNFLLVGPSGEWLVRKEGRQDGRSVMPPEPGQLPFLVPELAQVEGARIRNPRDLWEIVGAWIRRCAVPPAGYLDMLIAFVFHTHCTERSIHSPILALVGTQEHGKTRLGSALLHVARRGILTEAPRDAHLLRLANDLDATLFLDCWDLWQAVSRRGAEDIILHRFARGAKVMRVTRFEAGPLKDTNWYRVYGPTILASNKSLPSVLESRCLHVAMGHQKADGLTYPLEEDALPIRAALIAWRAGTLGQELPFTPNPLSGRMADIGKALLQLTKEVAPDRLESVLRALTDMQEERHDRNAASAEGKVVRALVELRAVVKAGLLSVETVTDEANASAERGFELTNQHVGNLLRELGLRTRLFGAKRLKHVVYDWDRVRSLAETLLGLEFAD